MPDLVVVALYPGNDFSDLLRNALFGLDDRGELIRHRPRLSDAALAVFKRASDMPRLQIARAWNDAWSTARGRRSETKEAPKSPGAWVKSTLRYTSLRYHDVVEKGRYTIGNMLDSAYSIDVSVRPESRSAIYERTLAERIIARIQSLAEQRGVPLLFVVIPNPGDALDHYCRSIDPIKYPAYRQSALTDLVEGIIVQRGSEVVNLYGAFHGAGAERLFFPCGNDHWSADGQALAAELVAQKIVGLRLLRSIQNPSEMR